MRSAQLSIVVPTFKERDNVAELVRRLDLALAGIAWEAIFVDDNSPDGTAEAVKEIGRHGIARRSYLERASYSVTCNVLQNR